MRKIMVLFALMMALGQWACQLVGGTASWNTVTVESYESNSDSDNRMNQLAEDYRAGRVTRRDYDARKGQVEIGSIHF
jgi:hypothetical protein